MGYVFISYSSKDVKTANAIRNYLNENGVLTWIAPDCIPVGNTYAAAINEAIEGCSCFLLVLSENTQNSKWVPLELNRAVNYGKKIFPVQIGCVKLNKEFDLYISTTQTITIGNWDKESREAKKLLEDIVKLIDNHEVYNNREIYEDLERIEKAPSKQTKKKVIIIFAAIVTVVIVIILIVILRADSMQDSREEDKTSLTVSAEKNATTNIDGKDENNTDKVSVSIKSIIINDETEEVLVNNGEVENIPCDVDLSVVLLNYNEEELNLVSKWISPDGTVDQSIIELKDFGRNVVKYNTPIDKLRKWSYRLEDMEGNVIDEITIDTVRIEIKMNDGTEEGYAYKAIAGEEFDGGSALKWLSYYDEDGNLVLGPYGYATEKFTYDDNRNLTSMSYYGTDGEPIRYKGHAYASWQATYDDNRNLTSMSYYGTDGELVLCDEGYASMKATYDSSGKCTSLKYYGADGQELDISEIKE